MNIQAQINLHSQAEYILGVINDNAYAISEAKKSNLNQLAHKLENRRNELILSYGEILRQIFDPLIDHL